MKFCALAPNPDHPKRPSVLTHIFWSACVDRSFHLKASCKHSSGPHRSKEPCPEQDRAEPSAPHPMSQRSSGDLCFLQGSRVSLAWPCISHLHPEEQQVILSPESTGSTVCRPQRALKPLEGQHVKTQIAGSTPRSLEWVGRSWVKHPHC